MRTLTRLQGAINSRYDRLADTDAETIDHQVALTRDWIKAQPELRAILAEAEQVEPDLDFETWLTDLEDANDFAWPSRTEAGRAWLVWLLMNEVAAGDADGATYQIRGYSKRFKDSTTDGRPRVWSNNQVREFVKQVFNPLFNYLSDHVGHGSAVLHVLQRYVAWVEWYDRDELDRRYKEAVDADHVGEEVYNLDLQRFLFLDGGYITQAKARSASGEADLIGGLNTDDPLICEGKLFTGRKSRITDGFHQVIKYANDYNKNVAYLVVFNMTDRLLKFPTDGVAGAWLPYIETAGVRVHLIDVRALPPATTASKAGKATTMVISREDLVKRDDQADVDTAAHEMPPAGPGI